MKIAVTSYGKDLTSEVDRSFGRAKWFVVIDVETGTSEAYSNEQNVNAAQGAGIQAARNVADLGVDAVVTGNVGPKAFRALTAASVKMYIVDKNIKTVGKAFMEWKDGNLEEVTQATVESHWV
ncbi:MAG TPA: dinitrogenase iron-molybdenum cofactor biosynthesis protein [Deltaproteobacteria bacterium]|nr:dinitrogenase iron-molybdenum cofactor biosynthesis protein [Deltaproteobacteria bacterium]